MSTDTGHDGDSAVGLEAIDGIELPRSFIVEAGGPVTVVRENGDVVEYTESELTVTRELETLEAFGEFWTIRDNLEWKRHAVDLLLEEYGTDVSGYLINEEQLETWDVLADGHAQAFFGLGELIAAGVDVEALDDSLSREFANRVAHARGDVGEIVAAFARDLETSELWGPGAQIAEIAVRHGEREDLEGHVEALLEEVSDDRR